MRVKVIKDRDGKPFMAMVTLSPVEREIVLARRVPAIYAPGGMGPDLPEKSATVRFGGACGSPWRYLDASLEAFRAALRDEADFIKASRKMSRAAAREKRKLAQHEADARAGFHAFPSGQFADALRGTKGYPDHARCPYRKPERVAAWTAGYNAAHDAMIREDD